MRISEQADQLLARGRVSEATALVKRAAATGDADAAFHLALWYLVGEPLPRDLGAARAALRDAAEAGHIDAGMMEVALTANGTGAPRDWAQALQRLRALAPHHPPAAQQLALVDAMPLGPDGLPSKPPSGRSLRAAPAVTLYPRFATPEECRELAEAAMPIMAPSVVVDPRTGRQMQNPVRTSSGAVLGPTRETLVVQAIAGRIAAATETQPWQGEPFSVLHYAPGQEYRPHLDALPATRNQRVKTAILYLNEGYEGGETQFTASGLAVRGAIGDLLVFDNVASDGTTDPLSRHAGLPVHRGVKWIATRWIRAQPYDPWTYREGN